ncbi:hypothetical protein [Haladaptatus sp. DJG-WS-42]|uniref:hypothetical protein n=1 Tax=Haladaptatus sp. DJG-WS-42 TaxID=3120516 RepID=UPI0030D5690D
MPSPPTRRRLLAVCAGALSVGVAGCLGASSGTPEETDTPPPAPVPTDETQTPTTSTTTEDQQAVTGGGRSLELTLFEPTYEHLGKRVTRDIGSFDEATQVLITDLVEEGTATRQSYDGPGMNGHEFVSTGDETYHLSVEATERQEATAQQFTLDAISKCPRSAKWDAQRARNEAVAFENLSAEDQASFLFLGEDTFAQEGCFSAGYGYVYDSKTAVEQSQLIDDDPSFVEYDAEYYAIEFRGTQSVEMVTYEYAAARLDAGSPTALGKRIAPFVAATLNPDDLPSEERAVLDDLLENHHYDASDPVPDAAMELKFRLTAKGRWGERNQYYCTIEETLYSVNVQEVVA